MIRVVDRLPNDICQQFDRENLTNNAVGRILKYQPDIPLIRYGIKMTKSEMTEYEQLEEALFSKSLFILKNLNIKSFFVIAYDGLFEFGDWMTEYTPENDCHENCVLFLDDISDVHEIFIKALRHQAFPIIIDEQLQMSFVPTDHLDVFFSFDREEVLMKMGNISSPFELVEWN